MYLAAQLRRRPTPLPHRHRLTINLEYTCRLIRPHSKMLAPDTARPDVGNKTPDDYYDEEYAKEQGKQDARRASRRKAANRYDDEYDREMGKQDARRDAANEIARERARREAAQTRGCLLTVLVVLAVPVLGCGGFALIGLFAGRNVANATSPAAVGEPAARSAATTTKATEATSTSPPTPQDTRPSAPVATSTKSTPTSARSTPTAPTRPTATLTPPKGGHILITDSQYALTQVTNQPESMPKWVERGAIFKLTEPTEVEVVNRDKEVSKVLVAGQTRFVQTRWLPPEKK